jgi:hypothetical protein
MNLLSIGLIFSIWLIDYCFCRQESDIECFKRKNGDLMKLFRDRNNHEIIGSAGKAQIREQKCWNVNDVLNISTPFLLLQNRAKQLRGKGMSSRNMTSILRYSKATLRKLFWLVKGSVQIISVDDHVAEMYDYIKYGKLFRTDAYLNQHSPELWIPFVLQHHKHSSKLLYHSVHNANEKTRSKLSQPISSGYDNSTLPPLFYYLEAHVFTFGLYVGNEDRILVNNIQFYWSKLLKQFSNHPMWKSDNGKDILIPASHPMTALNINDEVNRLHLLAQASFLVTDHDVKSRYMKDTIIPYFTYDPILQKTVSDRDVFILFAGKANQQLRKLTIRKFEEIHRKSQSLSPEQDLVKGVMIREKFSSLDEYHQLLHRSTFCLHIRGDTTSSSRFFSAIQAGCIPVIISDWMILPYERIIYYDSFTIRVEESVLLNDPFAVIRYLRSISMDTIRNMQQALVHAKEVLSYDSSHELNAVSLLFVDSLLHRIDYCRGIHIVHRNSQRANSISTKRSHQITQSQCHRLESRIATLLGVGMREFHDELIFSSCRMRNCGITSTIS